MRQEADDLKKMIIFQDKDIIALNKPPNMVVLGEEAVGKITRLCSGNGVAILTFSCLGRKVTWLSVGVLQPTLTLSLCWLCVCMYVVLVRMCARMRVWTGKERHLQGMLHVLQGSSPDPPYIISALDKEESGIVLLGRFTPPHLFC